MSKPMWLAVIFLWTVLVFLELPYLLEILIHSLCFLPQAPTKP